jgi:hypothetical protein
MVCFSLSLLSTMGRTFEEIAEPADRGLSTLAHFFKFFAGGDSDVAHLYPPLCGTVSTFIILDSTKIIARYM